MRIQCTLQRLTRHLSSMSTSTTAISQRADSSYSHGLFHPPPRAIQKKTWCYLFFKGGVCWRASLNYTNNCYLTYDLIFWGSFIVSNTRLKQSQWKCGATNPGHVYNQQRPPGLMSLVHQKTKMVAILFCLGAMVGGVKWQVWAGSCSCPTNGCTLQKSTTATTTTMRSSCRPVTRSS